MGFAWIVIATALGAVEHVERYMGDTEAFRPRNLGQHIPLEQLRQVARTQDV